MTLAVGVAVPEGLVVGADTRMSYRNVQGWPRIASAYGFKVFQVTDRVAAATFGWAYLNRKNINSIVEEFKLGAPRDARFIDEVLSSFIDYFEDQYNQHIAPGQDGPVPAGHIAFGFLVGGYDKQNVSKLYQVLIPGKMITEVGTPGAVWQGQIDVVTRLIKGGEYCQRLPTTSHKPFSKLFNRS